MLRYLVKIIICGEKLIPFTRKDTDNTDTKEQHVILAVLECRRQIVDHQGPFQICDSTCCM